jgi:AAA15 family ATPase/GTPase
MKLKKVRVKHFRNIIDSTDVEIEDDITCLVGKNESGKTAFLQSLYRLNPVRENIKFSIPDNYPAWLEKDHRLKGINLANEIPISATFSLEEDEIKLIEDVFGTGILIGNEFDLMRNYAGNLSLFLSVNENTLVKHMLANFQFNQNISTELRKSKTIEELHEVIERLHKRVNISDEVKSQLSIIQINIDELIGPDGLKNAIFTYLKDKMPQFFYFDKYSSLPYSVDITKLLRFNESQLNES